MNLSKLLHQILYHAGKFLTKQYFLKENVLPEICHQLFVLFVSLWWVGESGPCAQRQGGSLYFQSTEEERVPRIAWAQTCFGESKRSPSLLLYRAAQKHCGHPKFRLLFSWGYTRFLFLPDSARQETEEFRAASKHRMSKIPLFGKYIHNVWDLWALRSHTWRNHTNISSSQKDP